MHPWFGQVPAFVIGWGLAAALGGVALVWLLARARFRPWQIAVAFAAIAISLFVGSKFLYLIEAWPRVVSPAADWRTLLLSPEMRIPGGLTLAVAIGPPLAYLLGVPYLRFADAVVPAAGLLLVGIRVGCLLEGCCFGTPSTLPWAVTFPAYSLPYWWQVEQGLIAGDAASPLPVHPLQLYFAGVGLALFAGLAAYAPRKRYGGEILLLAALVYLWSTFGLEFLRATPHAFTRAAVLAGAIGVTLVAARVELKGRSSRQALASLPR